MKPWADFTICEKSKIGPFWGTTMMRPNPQRGVYSNI